MYSFADGACKIDAFYHQLSSLLMNRRLGQFITALIFAMTIFLGAFLLFQVQPLLGRFLLPWFGGSPEVWTTCMLFFQIFLLAGYAYAHWLIRLQKTRHQAIIHISLLAIALLFLPILPSESLKPSEGSYPILQILLICSLTVGLPYLLLSATSPLIQVWFGHAFPRRSPYRLYSMSNFGSLLALGSFPFVFEPLLSRLAIVHIWSFSFVVFAVLCSVCVLLGRFHMADRSLDKSVTESNYADDQRHYPKWLWLALPAAGTLELLAVTNKITQDIAVIPFLWVLPLSLYLLSFIICFEHQRWYKRWLFVPLFILGMVGVIWARLHEDGMTAYQIIAIYNFMLFFCCMVCHGELYRLRPDPKHLTGYYLMISAGGALGGFFVAVICPLIFNTYVELYLGLLFCACCLLLTETGTPASQRKRRPFWIGALTVVAVSGILFMGEVTIDDQRLVDRDRNFFGGLAIWEQDWQDTNEHILLMQHGTTFHGLQFQLPEKRNIPTAYYAPHSGVGLTLENLPKQQNRRIGIVGLGVGTIAAYGHESDTIRFYEINPQVEELAREYFTYLQDCPAEVEIVLGDARLSMETEPPQQYDVLVLDAFSSDAVPLHLLTVEAMQIYLRHLADDGILAFHISTMHLDLHSVVWKLADHLNLKTTWIEAFEDDTEGALASDWILLAREDTFLESEVIKSNRSAIRNNREQIRLWTDDHLNLLQIMKKSPLHR